MLSIECGQYCLIVVMKFHCFRTRFITVNQDDCMGGFNRKGEKKTLERDGM